jgi:hypothetical protein
MCLARWQAPAVPNAGRAELGALAVRTFQHQTDHLVDALCHVDGSPVPPDAWTVPEDYGRYLPSRATLASAREWANARGDQGVIQAQMGLLVRAAKANVGGQARRFVQARRRFRRTRNWRSYHRVFTALLNFVDWTHQARATLEWQEPRFKHPTDLMAWRERMGIEAGCSELDPAAVTRVDPTAPFFFAKSARELVLYLQLRKSNTSVCIVPTDGPADYSSVYALMKDISTNAPMDAPVGPGIMYAVRRSGISLGPPFVRLVAPLKQPPTKALDRWWCGVLQKLLVYSQGGCTTAEVRAQLQSTRVPDNTAGGSGFVTSTNMIAWLIDNPACWHAVGCGHSDEFRGPVALFRDSERRPAP